MVTAYDKLSSGATAQTLLCQAGFICAQALNADNAAQ